MPKPVVISKEMIDAAALNLLRESGASALSVRSIAHALGSSTKPIYRTYGSMEGLRERVAELACEYMRDQIYSYKRSGNALLDAGIGYVMNAVNNRHLFHFICLNEKSYHPEFSTLPSKRLLDVFAAPLAREGLTLEEVKEVVGDTLLFTYGLAMACFYGTFTLSEEEIGETLWTFFTRLMRNEKEWTPFPA